MSDDLPADQAMLLRLIDAKFETFNAKLDGVRAAVEGIVAVHQRYDERLDDHEKRIQRNEAKFVARELQVADYDAFKRDTSDKLEALIEKSADESGAERVKRFVFDLVKPALIAGGVFLASLYFNHPAQVEHRQTTKIETVASAPSAP